MIFLQNIEIIILDFYHMHYKQINIVIIIVLEQTEQKANRYIHIFFILDIHPKQKVPPPPFPTSPWR